MRENREKYLYRDKKRMKISGCHNKDSNENIFTKLRGNGNSKSHIRALL